MTTPFFRQPGRRGMALLFFAMLDAIYGLSLIIPDQATRAGDQFRWLSSIAPLWGWASLWFAVSLACLVAAFQTFDRVGFTAAIFLKLMWGLLTLTGWLVAGVDRGYVSAAIWLTAAGFVWIISGWPEPGKETLWTTPM
jgi:hypothetical protein